MIRAKGIPVVIGGLAFLVLAITNKNFFALKGWNSGDKPIPRWAGATLFAFIGLFMIAMGLEELWAR